MRLIDANKLLVAIIGALTLALSSAVPVSACTPPLKPPSVKIPDINFQPDGALEKEDKTMCRKMKRTIMEDKTMCRKRRKDAINNAVKNWLEKCVLATPVVKYASYYKSASRYFHYAYVAFKWSEVGNATSYKVRITKADGTWKEYDTTYTAFYRTNCTDDFIADGMDGATVSVKAYGNNDTFGCWSDDTNITRFRY